VTTVHCRLTVLFWVILHVRIKRLFRFNALVQNLSRYVEKIKSLEQRIVQLERSCDEQSDSDQTKNN
jgi:hypothetical protein